MNSISVLVPNSTLLVQLALLLSPPPVNMLELDYYNLSEKVFHQALHNKQQKTAGCHVLHVFDIYSKNYCLCAKCEGGISAGDIWLPVNRSNKRNFTVFPGIYQYFLQEHN